MSGAKMSGAKMNDSKMSGVKMSGAINMVCHDRVSKRLAQKERH